MLEDELVRIGRLPLLTDDVGYIPYPSAGEGRSG